MLFKYDSSGRLIETASVKPSGEIIYKNTNSYDDKGRMIAETGITQVVRFQPGEFLVIPATIMFHLGSRTMDVTVRYTKKLHTPIINLILGAIG